MLGKTDVHQPQFQTFQRQLPFMLHSMHYLSIQAGLCYTLLLGQQRNLTPLPQLDGVCKKLLFGIQLHDCV